MADEVTRTIVDGMGGTGTALGAGVGGLFGSWFGNAWNGNGGFGGNNNTYLANQLSAIQTQAVANGIANRDAVSGMSQHLSDAINSNGRDTNQAINNANVQAVKDSGDTRLTISQTGNNVAQLITALGANFAQAIGTINENITKTSYESRLQQTLQSLIRLFGKLPTIQQHRLLTVGFSRARVMRQLICQITILKLKLIRF